MSQEIGYGICRDEQFTSEPLYHQYSKVNKLKNETYLFFKKISE